MLTLPALLIGGGAARADALPALPVSLSSAPVTAVELSSAVVVETSSAQPRFVWGLVDVINIALGKNPDLQSAQDNYEAASRVLQESYSAYLPNVDGSAYTGRTTLPSPSAGSTPLLGLDRKYSVGAVEMSQTLLDFGRGLEEIRARRAESRSSADDLAALQYLIKLNTERAFYNVASDEKLVAVSMKSLAKFQETYRRTLLMVQAGTRPSFDLSQAQVELSKAELAVINAKNARDLSKIALLNIMGVDRVETFALRESGQLVPMVKISALSSMERLTDFALESRPEMRGSRLLMEAALDRLKEQRRTYLPTIAASGWAGRYLPDYPESIRGAWGYGIGASWNLFDGLATKFRVKELEARFDQAGARLKRQSQNIVAEVASSYMNLVRAEQNETVADEALGFANENFHYAQLRYDANVGTILELLIAETSLVDADAAQVQARYRYTTALAALQRAVNAPLIETP